MLKLNRRADCIGMMAASMLFHVGDCRGGRRTSVVACKAVFADHSGIASSRGRWWGWKRTKPCIIMYMFSRAVRPASLWELCLRDGRGCDRVSQRRPLC